MEFNINDYAYDRAENFSTPTKVEYKDVSDKDMSRYSDGAMISFKDRPDMSGAIKRIEDGQIVFNMFEQTYKMPDHEFDSLFFVRDNYSPQNWYTRSK
jgi:hypothetical protein